MRRPLVPIAIAFCIGIVLGESCEIASSLWLYCSIGMLIVCAVALAFSARQLALVPLVLMVTAAGAAYYRLRLERVVSSEIRTFLSEGRQIVKVRGIISSFPTLKHKQVMTLCEAEDEPEGREYISFTLRVTHAFAGGTVAPATGLLRVNLYEPDGTICYGQVVEVAGHARLPPRAHNPGQFDYRTFLERKGIVGLMAVPNRAQIDVLGTGGSVILRVIDKVRRRAIKNVRSYLREPAAGIICCMLLGERHAVSREVEEDFRRTGTVHVLAVSGLHVMILAGSLWYALLLLGVGRKTCAAVVLTFVCFYAAIAGMRAPILRAGVISVVLCTGVLLDRQGSTLNSLAAAALFILILSPAELFGAGFQLSFLAVIGILCLYGPILDLFGREDEILRRLRHPEERNPIRDILSSYMKRNISISSAVWLATAPLVAYYFHLITPLVIVFNILVFPLVWLILSLGVLSLQIMLILPPLGVGGLWVAGVMASLLHKTVYLGNLIPFSFCYVSGPSAQWLVLYYVILSCAVFVPAFRGKKIAVVTSAFLLAAVPIYMRAIAPCPKELKVSFLDVGHGNTVVMRLPSGRCIIYDVAGSPGFDIGANIIAPFLWNEGVDFIDAVIISHPHYDHFGGLVELSQRFRIGCVFTTPAFDRSKLARAMRVELEKKGIAFEHMNALDVFEEGDLRVEVLHPPELLEELLLINDASAVVRVSLKDFALLLTGDIQDTGMLILQGRYKRLASDLLQVPHHGNKISPMLVTDVVPARLAVISAGEYEVSSEVCEALRKSGCTVLKTCDVGAVLVVVTENRIDMRTFLHDNP